MRWLRRRGATTGMRRTRATVGLGLLTVLAAGCAPGAAPPPPTAVASPVPTPTATAPPPAAPPTAALPSAADGTDVSACQDGTCEIEVTTPTDVPLSTFGIRRWRIGASGPDGITFDLRPRGGDIDTGPQGTLSGTSSDTSTEGTVSGRGATISKRGIVMTLVAGDGVRTVVRFARG